MLDVDDGDLSPKQWKDIGRLQQPIPVGQLPAVLEAFRQQDAVTQALAQKLRDHGIEPDAGILPPTAMTGVSVSAVGAPEQQVRRV